MKPAIVVMGANPAWQKTLRFAGLHKNQVCRALRMEAYPAGKGINFCRAAACFGQADTVLLQFAGGPNGKLLCDGLDAEGIRHETVATANETRCCITCLDSADGSMTELIEPSGRVTPAEAAQFLERLKRRLEEGAALFAMTGSLPDGTDLSLYEKAAALAAHAGIPILVDAVQGIAPVLEFPARIILKVNREEFLRLTRCDALQPALRHAAKRWPNACFAVTDGPENAFFADGERYGSFTLPKLTTIESPLGAGDTAAAVLASCLAVGTDLAEALRRALAAASANCLTERAGTFRMEECDTLFPQILMTELTG